MVFSSLPFLFLFLTVVLLVSHILPFRFRNFFLLLANLVFYAYGEPVYVLIMIGSILVNFFAGLLMDKQSTQGRRRAVLVVGIVTAFVMSVVSIKFLMGYIKKNDFTAFGWYRIVVGVLVLGYFVFESMGMLP